MALATFLKDQYQEINTEKKASIRVEKQTKMRVRNWIWVKWDEVPFTRKFFRSRVPIFFAHVNGPFNNFIYDYNDYFIRFEAFSLSKGQR